MDTSEIDNIKLTPGLFQNLYPRGVTNLDIKVPSTGENLSFEGENKQHILIGTDNRGPLKPEDRDLLGNLLKACYLKMEDVALVNFGETQIPVSSVVSQLKIKKGIFFGVPLLSIDINLGKKEDVVMAYEDKQFIRSAPLSGLQHNVDKKKLLWAALKNMFGL